MAGRKRFGSADGPAVGRNGSGTESLHSQVRKAIRNKGHFPGDDAATKLIYLALRNITAKWINPGNGMLPRHSSRSSSETDLC